MKNIFLIIGFLLTHLLYGQENQGSVKTDTIAVIESSKINLPKVRYRNDDCIFYFNKTDLIKLWEDNINLWESRNQDSLKRGWNSRRDMINEQKEFIQFTQNLKGEELMNPIDKNGNVIVTEDEFYQISFQTAINIKPYAHQLIKNGKFELYVDKRKIIEILQLRKASAKSYGDYSYSLIEIFTTKDDFQVWEQLLEMTIE